MIKLNKNSWHYKLITFVGFKKLPKNVMEYQVLVYWCLIFCPFVFLFKMLTLKLGGLAS